MSVEALSRIQFATVAIFHFLFVPLTLGLSALVAFMETRYAATGDEIYLRMTKYWSKLFLVNFAVGVVTGITLEFQFGMNWAEYSKFVGDIFGAPLAIEATVAFFLESTFLGLWMFSWKRVSKGIHAAIMWVVAFASTLSALWILLANGWMQKPRGFVLVGGRAQLVDFGALLWNPYAWIKLFHAGTAAFTLASFFVMGISAYPAPARQGDGNVQALLQDRRHGRLRGLPAHHRRGRPVGPPGGRIPADQAGRHGVAVEYGQRGALLPPRAARSPRPSATASRPSRSPTCSASSPITTPRRP